jgi:hypothetical protein
MDGSDGSTSSARGLGFRSAPVLGGALLAVTLAASLPALAAPPQPAASAQAPQRVLDVTFAPVAPPAGQRMGPQPASRRVLTSGLLVWTAAAVLTAAAGGLLAWRRRPRRCASCRAAMRRLGREAAFAELDMAERTEQLVGEVRYEVWRCTACETVDKRGTARDLSRLNAGAGGIGAPVGSAAFLRRRAQSGLSIWSAPAPAEKPWPRPIAVSPAARRVGSRPGTEDPIQTEGDQS